MPTELPPGMAAHSEEGSPETSNRQVLLLVGLFIGFIVGLFWLVLALAGNLILLLPTSVEQQLGKAIVPVYAQRAKPSPAQETLNKLLNGLEQYLDGKAGSRDYQVLYIPEATVNALAIPGDRVILFKGLIAQAKSENELVMVLGHELGHFVNRDHLRGLGRGLAVQIMLSVLIGDGSALQNIAVSGAANLSQSRFSQGQELKADEVGLTLLNEYYGHVAGAIDFFERLKQIPGQNLDFLTTHPAPKRRIEKLRRLIEARGYAQVEKTPLPSTLVNLE